MSITTGCTREVEEFHPRSEGRELIVNTSGGHCSLAPSLLGLKIFQVRGNYYNQVIGDISKELVWLRWFDIGQNNLSSLGSLKKLRVLELYEKKISKHFLEELWETDSDAPVQLRELVISKCYNFQRFPTSIGCLRDLKKLVLSNGFGNKMRSLPTEICLLQSLEHLELSGCEKLSSLPSSFGHLQNLRHLDLSNCVELRSLPVSFKKLTLLQHFNLQGCSKLTLELDILENMMKLEYLKLSNCEQLEELPRHITNQVSLRELYLDGIRRLRELPVNISQLSKLRVMKIGSELLTSLPTSLGDLSSLTALVIKECPKLERIPESLGHLNLLEYLEISNSGVDSLPKSVRQLNNLCTLSIFGSPITQLDLRAGSFASPLCNLKLINLVQTEVSMISIPHDCCPGLETLFLDWNKHLTEIEVLPSTVKDIRLLGCKMLRSVRGIDGLVNIQWLRITGCPQLDVLPSFAQLASLQVFELQGCYEVKKIPGLEHCRALEELTAETRWEEAGIESLERMERLRIVKLTAINRSAVEGCIQSLQKCPEEIVICTRAVPDAGSLENFFFDNIAGLGIVVESDDNQNINSNAHGILVCFVVNCESPKTELVVMSGNMQISSAEVEEGKWVWIALFSQGSRWHRTEGYQIVAFSTLWDITTPPSRGLTALSRGITRIPLSTIDPLLPPTLSIVCGVETPISTMDTMGTMCTIRSIGRTFAPYQVERAFTFMGEVEELKKLFICVWRWPLI